MFNFKPLFMQYKCIQAIILTLLTSICFHALGAEPSAIPVKIIDQHGKPVHGAVVSYEQAIHANASNSPQQPPAIMDQVDQQFSPFVLAIKTGTPVSFPNSDDIRHHVYSFSAIHPFEIRLYKGTPSSPEVFAEQGVVELGCNIHDKMRGFIYVTDKDFSTASDKNGMTTVPVNISEVVVWHPRLARDTIKHIDMRLPAPSPNGTIEIVLNLVDGVDQPEHHTHRFNKKFQ